MTRRQNGVIGALALLLMLATGQLALAHPGHFHPEQASDLRTGLLHPLMGLDHMLACVAIGLLSVRLGGRALWMMPATCMLAMLTGGIAAVAGMPLLGAEFGLALSVVLLGTLVAAAPLAPAWVRLSLVASFAFVHGHVHAAEAAGGSLAGYFTGILLTSALLVAAGIAVGFVAEKLRSLRPFPIVGCGIAACGLAMMLTLF